MFLKFFNKKMIVLKEAENTINTYMKKIEKENIKKVDRNFRLKYNFLKVCNIMLIFSIIIITLVLV